ncbi:MAG: aminomethyl transferase family protein, partial [Gemmatimonadetes bacterium]|nr:aminomethyl transferase family protein [Gemmatimonadota bacterium]
YTGAGAVVAGEAVYGAILTPKGRMVTDLTTLWLGAGEGEGLGLDVATSGHAAVLGHFTRFLPPRFARVEDLGDRTGLLTVLGPRAEEVVADAFGTVPEDGYALLGGGPAGGGLLVARWVEQAPSWDIWAPAAATEGVWRRLEASGAVPVGWAVREMLRIEAGLPAFGVDMDDTTIPVEAGLLDRAFDHDKGCYTGQEVIVRIRHRGRVNWHLRAFRFGNAAPETGQQLFEADGTKVKGRVTSVAQSPRFGQAVGLGYVRREIEPPATLRLGSGSGPEVGVEEC